MGALSSLVIGIYHEGHIQGWIRLFVSCLATSVITFSGTFGLTLLSTKSLILALGSSMVAISVSLISLWIKSPLTKGVPILYFGEIEAARISDLTKTFEVYDENKK